MAGKLLACFSGHRNLEKLMTKLCLLFSTPNMNMGLEKLIILISIFEVVESGEHHCISQRGYLYISSFLCCYTDINKCITSLACFLNNSLACFSQNQTFISQLQNYLAFEISIDSWHNISCIIADLQNEASNNFNLIDSSSLTN